MVRRVALLVLVGCAGPDWRNADLQLDVTGMTISDEDQVRLCVEDAGQRDQAVGSGSVTFPGLPAQGTLRVTVDLLDEDQRLARAGPANIGGNTDYGEIPWRSCDDSCSPCEDAGKGAGANANGRLLAVRFLD